MFLGGSRMFLRCPWGYSWGPRGDFWGPRILESLRVFLGLPPDIFGPPRGVFWGVPRAVFRRVPGVFGVPPGCFWGPPSPPPGARRGRWSRACPAGGEPWRGDPKTPPKAPKKPRVGPQNPRLRLGGLWEYLGGQKGGSQPRPPPKTAPPPKIQTPPPCSEAPKTATVPPKTGGPLL